VALHAVYQVAAATEVPIIGTGGVSSGLDAVAMVSAGATAVGVGSAVYREGPEAFARLCAEIDDWLDEHGIALAAIRGRAHRPPQWPEAATRPPIPGQEGTT
jgi:dihydroorotate dehydrogenase (NAD+) catalytic subunit